MSPKFKTRCLAVCLLATPHVLLWAQDAPPPPKRMSEPGLEVPIDGEISILLVLGILIALAYYLKRTAK